MPPRSSTGFERSEPLTDQELYLARAVMEGVAACYYPVPGNVLQRHRAERKARKLEKKMTERLATGGDDTYTLRGDDQISFVHTGIVSVLNREGINGPEALPREPLTMSELETLRGMERVLASRDSK